MRKKFLHKTTCRVCSGPDLIKVLDLGLMPLSNAFLKKEELEKEEQKFPLAVHFCKNCGLLQLLDVINPEILFRHYYYLTSVNKPLADHFIELGESLVNKFAKSKNDLVIDIGGNDAVLLDSVKDKCRVLNIEPARNIAKLSKEKGIETIDEFFSEGLAQKILQKYGPAKVIVASNVIAHIDNLKDILRGVKTLISDKGVFVAEVHWVANLLGLAGIGSFDQIYHEHLSYFSLSVLKRLVNEIGLEIFDANLIPIHGKSLQIYISQNCPVSESVNEILAREKDLGLDRLETYLTFTERVAKNKNELKDLLLRLKAENKKIFGYGAPAKGNILLNYFQIDNRILDFIVDDSPLKQGLYCPGTHIPVLSPQKLKEITPDYFLLLAWNYADSILEKEKELRKLGVKFIIPVPEVKII